VSRPPGGSTPLWNAGRDGRNWARTSDLQRVELALFQLSYAPRGREPTNAAAPTVARIGSEQLLTTPW
jgi:hypothetical protein